MTKSKLKFLHGTLDLPCFLPDATFGFVRSMDSSDLIKCKIKAVMMNVFHLMQHPGSSVIKKFNGLHNLFNWKYPIITDSGGFQAYSLIKQNAKYGSITDNGIIFRPENSSKKINLTPEKSIRLQLSFGADAVICLDECTHVDDSEPSQQCSVSRTISWAKKCKEEFNRIIKQKNTSEEQRPLLFAVIQGGNEPELRRRCAKALLEIGFDGFGYGGYPLDKNGDLLVHMLELTRKLIPQKFPMLALGIGHPVNIVKCIKMGYSLFDCSLPTRDARKGRLYVLNSDKKISPNDDSWFSYLYIYDKKHIKTEQPVSGYCDCETCANYSLAYLHHLFKRNDSLYFRLASIHNLRFITKLMEKLN